MAENEGCLTHLVGKRGLNISQNEKLEIALLIPNKFKNKIRTIQPKIFEKIKNNQPELKFAGSYLKKECTYFSSMNYAICYFSFRNNII